MAITPVYNAQITRDEADPLMPDLVANKVFEGAISKSLILPRMTRLPNMTAKQSRLPVQQLLPTAYFVNGDSDLRQTSDMKWKNKEVIAEEICVIVPVPSNVIDDSQYPIWDQAMPRCEEAIAACADGGIIIGTNKPSSWPSSVKTQAQAAGVYVSRADFSNLYLAMLGTNGLFSKVETRGFMVDGVIADMSLKGRLRGVVDSQNRPILNSVPQSPMNYELDGAPVVFNENACFDSDDADCFAGKWRELVYSIRSDINFRVAIDGVIQDGSGRIIFNLTQQRMAALIMWIRMGWQAPNPPTRLAPDEGVRFPIGYLTA